MFNLKNKNLYIYIPGIILLIFSIIFFIYSSPYQNDIKVAKWFENLFDKSELLKYVSQYYLVAGNTDLFLVIIFMVMIIIKYKFLSKANKKEWYKQNYWITNLILSILTSFFIIGWIYELVFYITSDTGFGVGIDAEIFLSVKYKITGKIFSGFYQFPILGYINYYLIKNFHKINVNKLNKFYIDAKKALLFLIINYIIVGSIKMFGGRPYYYNVIFNELFNKMSLEQQQNYIESGFRYGYYSETTNAYTGNVTGEWPWWRMNSIFNRSKEDFLNKNPYDYGFPSGHVVSSFSLVTFLYLKFDRNKKTSIWSIVFVYFLSLNAINMNLSTILCRGHWMTDTSFSFIIILITFFILDVYYKYRYK
ncbi:hypothetical protein SLITO_v1c06110 [Spiroplasma litorale]|uniref:Phosphatidic acid phosphatase type 2/haloperoxidase domain-containing protein n=1 Tax=Spiroplasma litorale TaxID=216942 RepID=A0A0K1W1P8_9MOLU|nr:phosphatase PAP2 family protein [Spiroplasma litorale]AKX34245.1 hypothetical protein SLITO_v1c06110 [Spiroplasma litorale]